MQNRTTSSRRFRRAMLAAVVVAFAACHEEVSSSYGPVPDTAAMRAIQSAWSEPGGLSLALCEDVARAEVSPADGCQADHVVRGGGLGLEQHTSHPGGCGSGGCPFGNLAYVHGTASGAGLAGAAAVSGIVFLQNGHADDPYAYPYDLELTCDDAAAPCSIEGTLAADGHVDATLILGRIDSGLPKTQHPLARTDAAVCP